MVSLQRPDLPAGSDSIKGAARQTQAAAARILATTEKHPPSFSTFVLTFILKATGGHVKIYSQLQPKVSWNFWGFLLRCPKEKVGTAPCAVPAPCTETLFMLSLGFSRRRERDPAHVHIHCRNLQPCHGLNRIFYPILHRVAYFGNGMSIGHQDG